MDDTGSFNTLMNKIQVNYNIKKIQIKSIANVYNGNGQEEETEEGEDDC